MTKIYEYRNSKWETGDKARTQEQLKKMATKIFENGTIKSEDIYYGTTNVFTVICKDLPIKYIVKIDCFEVEEIIEMIEL